MPPKRGKREKVAAKPEEDAAKEETKTEEPGKEDDAKKEEAPAEKPKEDDKDVKKEEEPAKEAAKKGGKAKKEEKPAAKKKAAPKKKDEKPAEAKDNGKGDDKKDEEMKEEGDDKKRARDDDEEKDDGAPSGKRARKSTTSAAYTPDDFTQTKNHITTIAGRGTKLRNIPSLKASIESTNANSEVFQTAFKLVFRDRAKVHPKEAKQLMLDYNGYLPVQDKDADKEKAEKEEEDIETKYSKKAYKLTVPQIKQLCAFFDVDLEPDEGEKVDKDFLIERLLDLLSNPSEDQTNGDEKKPATKKAPAKKKKKAASKPKKDDASEDGKFSEGKIPDDKELRRWVKAYVACHNMNTATTKHALEVATTKFGVDMKPKKKTIKLFLTEEC